MTASAKVGQDERCALCAGAPAELCAAGEHALCAGCRARPLWGGECPGCARRCSAASAWSCRSGASRSASTATSSARVAPASSAARTSRPRAAPCAGSACPSSQKVTFFAPDGSCEVVETRGRAERFWPGGRLASSTSRGRATAAHARSGQLVFYWPEGDHMTSWRPRRGSTPADPLGTRRHCALCGARRCPCRARGASS